MPKHLLIVGASGVIGSGAIEHFAGRDCWSVTALSRRRPIVADVCNFRHVAVDLSMREECRAALEALPPVSHLIYAAVAEAPGLVGGWRDPAMIALNGRMFENAVDPLAASGHLRHVSMLQGTKAYGAHVHAVEIPAREDRSRDDHANFYWLHEDHLRRRAADFRIGFTIFRPQVLLGAAPGAAMNLVVPLSAYAAICRELGSPFAFPGGAASIMEAVDTGLLAEAFEWAATSTAAAGQIFNISNGDVLVLRQAWPMIAEAVGLTAGGEPPASIADFFARDDCKAAWARLVERNGLRIADLTMLLGESHHYLDLLLGSRIADNSVPVILSTIKLRQAGFGACRDSVASLVHWLDRLEGLRLVPPTSKSRRRSPKMQ